MNKKKIINLLLALSSLAGYLEWGKGQHSFIFQVIIELFSNKTNVSSFSHPLILIPLAGLVLLISTLFQEVPGRILSLLGLTFLSSIMLLLLFIGCISLNIKMIVATIPFIVSGIFCLKHNWKRNT